MFTPMRLVGTACGGLLPSFTKAEAISLKEGGSVHADAAMQNRFFDKLTAVKRLPFLFTIHSELRIPNS